MAVETLNRSLQEAAELMGDPRYFDLIQEMQPPRVYEETIDIPGVGQALALRAHSGPEAAKVPADDGELSAFLTIPKGGIRFYQYPSRLIAVEKACELAAEMEAKVNVWGHPEYAGGKGVLVVDSYSLSHGQREAAAAAYERFMEAKGLAGYGKDVPAGDAGTNGLSDIYALERRRLNPDDRFWQASVTGKSPENGGLDERTEATGRGLYESQRTIMDIRGEEDAEAVVQGFGNVGAWYACAAYEGRDPETGKQRITIQAISDLGGILSTSHPDGIQVTRHMVETLIEDPLYLQEHPEYKGNKLHALADMVQRHQPGIELTVQSASDDIITYPTDYFVPASPVTNVINGNTIGKLGARRGFVEGTNGASDPAGHAGAIRRGLLVDPDILSNGLGVNRSIKEHKQNILAAGGQVLRTVVGSMTEATETTTRHVLRIAETLGTPDLRVAAGAAYIGSRLASQGIRIDADFLRPEQRQVA